MDSRQLISVKTFINNHMIQSNGKSNERHFRSSTGMSFSELLHELKRLRVQMRYSREIQKESELLDAEYHQIVKMQKRGELTLFDVPDDTSESKEKT
jgi:hypothetical protein